MRRLLAFCAVALAAGAVPGRLSAQAPGTLDTSFTSGVSGSTIFAVTTETINEQELIIVGGDVDLLDRLFLNGVADTNFKLPDIGNLSRIVYTAVPQVLTGQLDQDKTLIGGLFGPTPTASGAAGTGPAMNIARLNSDGLLDPSFNVGNGANAYVTSILPESNGSIYVGGLFTYFDKIPHNHVVRLNVDGSLDNTFASDLQINDAVLNVADQIDSGTGLPNGQILVVGTFSRVDQTNTAKIARLNHDGTLDTTFNPIVDTRVLTVLGEPDGKILIGGEFNSVNGQPFHNIARLNQDGTLDPTFTASATTPPPGTPNPTAVYVLKLLPDDRIYVGGNFYTVNGVRREYLARLLRDGALDTTFDPGSSIINSVQSLAIQTNYKLLVGETVSRKINNIFPESVVRLLSDNPPLPPVVTVSASISHAAEAGPGGAPVRGQFRLVRSGGVPANGLTVHVAVSGTAISGVEYKPLKLGGTFEKSFLPDISTETLAVRPTGKALTSPVTVTLTVLPDPAGGSNYTLGTQTSATVTISEH